MDRAAAIVRRGAHDETKHMSKDQDKIEHRHFEDKPDPGSRIFVMCAGALMIAAITFGLLNTFNVIHM